MNKQAIRISKADKAIACNEIAIHTTVLEWASSLETGSLVLYVGAETSF